MTPRLSNHTGSSALSVDAATSSREAIRETITGKACVKALSLWPCIYEEKRRFTDIHPLIVVSVSFECSVLFFLSFENDVETTLIVCDCRFSEAKP